LSVAESLYFEVIPYAGGLWHQSRVHVCREGEGAPPARCIREVLSWLRVEFPQLASCIDAATGIALEPMDPRLGTPSDALLSLAIQTMLTEGHAGRTAWRAAHSEACAARQGGTGADSGALAFHLFAKRMHTVTAATQLLARCDVTSPVSGGAPMSSGSDAVGVASLWAQRMAEFGQLHLTIWCSYVSPQVDR
jgi:hypothetical protein